MKACHQMVHDNGSINAAAGVQALASNQRLRVTAPFADLETKGPPATREKATRVRAVRQAWLLFFTAIMTVTVDGR